MKGIKRVLDLECPLARGNKKSALPRHSDNEKKRPPLHALEMIATDSNGDIRSAINSLQFLCGLELTSVVKNGSTRGTKRSVEGNAKKKTKSGREMAKL